MNLLRKIHFFVFGVAVFVAPSVLAQDLKTSVRGRIYAAAVSGNLTEIQRLKKMGYSLEMEDENGNTPYCQAVWSQNRLAVATLLKAGAKPKPKCLKRIPYVTESRIYSAAHAEDLEQLIEWKKEGLNIDVIDPKTGDSALCEAVYNYDCDAIKTLLRAGSLQSQACMRRIPVEVREKLQCRPLEIDWRTIGYTSLGIGMTGALIGVLGTGGGNGTPTCPPKQRWNPVAEECQSCDGCWKGNVCISKDKADELFYYPDETTAECWTVAPPPVDIEGDALDKVVQQISNTAKYKDGKFLPMINAAYAHARGYSGYFVKRTEPNGRLPEGDVSYGQDPKVTDKKVTVGILSSGMDIGSGGTATVDVDKDGVQEETIDVWDWSSVHQAFYNSYETKKMSYKPTGETITEVSSNFVGELGKVENNIKTDPTTDKPIGFNYDYGPCGDGQQKSCYAMEEVEIQTDPNVVIENKQFVVLYDSSGDKKYVKVNPLGFISFDKTPPNKDTHGNYARWTNDDETGIDDVYFSKFVYDDGYEYNKDDPSPHYIKKEKAAVRSMGTFLAGIVAAMKSSNPTAHMYGVAYNADILPVNKDIVEGISQEALASLVEYSDVILLDHATVVTLDKGAGRNDALGAFTAPTTGSSTWTAKDGLTVFGDDRWSAYDYLKKNITNKVVVVPNGSHQNKDYDLTQPSLESVLPLLMTNSTETWNENGTVLPKVLEENPLYNSYITVGSVVEVNHDEGTAELAAYSQPCGIAASYCLMAPGGKADDNEGLYSTSASTSGYISTYGTSSAAAVVAGSVALLMGAYPHLTSEEVVDILFKTATYIKPTDVEIDAYNQNGTYQTGGSGKYPYNSIYGRGVVNLEEATKPVGGQSGLWVRGPNAGTPIGRDYGLITAESTTLTSVASISLTAASALPATFTAFDAYDRPFQLSTSQLFNIQTRRQAKSFEDFKLFMRGRDAVLVQPSESFSMLYRQETNRVSDADIRMGLIQMNLKRNKMRYGLFYAQDTKQGKEAYWKRHLVNPFIKMKDAYGLELGYEMNQKWTVETGWTTGRNGFFEEDERFDEPENRMQAFTTSVVYKPVEKVAFKVATGVMKETGSSLGMFSGGGFDIQGANTHFVGAGVAFTPMDKVRLEAMYYYGTTKTTSDGGLMNFSRMASDSFAVTASYQPDDNTLFGLQVSSPLRVRSGSMNVTLPTGRHPTEDIFYYDTYRASMKPDAREIDMSLYYHGDVNEQIHLQSEFGVRLNPDHQADAKPDYRGMIGIKWNY